MNRRYHSEPEQRLYASREWREHIRPAQLRREPLCRFCDALGVVQEAEQVDHITRPKGDHTLQRDPDNLQSLCKVHHAAKSAWERKSSPGDLLIGHDRNGWPVKLRPPGEVQSLKALSCHTDDGTSPS